VIQLHALFVELTDHRGDSDERLASSRSTIRHARELLQSFNASS